jgi:hypothetical protein
LVEGLDFFFFGLDRGFGMIESRGLCFLDFTMLAFFDLNVSFESIRRGVIVTSRQSEEK